MSLLWAEPFDQYGGTTAFVGNSGYTDVGLNSVNVTGRTGQKAMNANNSGFLRMATPAAVTTLGQGVAMQLQTVGPPSDNYQNVGLRFESAGKTYEGSVVILADLSFGVYDRTQTLKGKTIPNMAIIGSYVWVEAKFVKNSGGVNTGSCEVRVNGVQRLVVNGMNNPNDLTFFSIGGFNAFNTFYDDWIVWDTNGLYNNNFMGDRRLFVSYPSANGATQDFTASAGSAFNCVKNSPPVDTTYINGAAAGNVSDFDKDLIGISSTDVAAVVIAGRMFKTDAGTAAGRLGINSAGNVANSGEFFPGTTGAYFYYPIERDPNGNIAWTKANVDAAKVRITRSQ